MLFSGNYLKSLKFRSDEIILNEFSVCHFIRLFYEFLDSLFDLFIDYREFVTLLKVKHFWFSKSDQGEFRHVIHFVISSNEVNAFGFDYSSSYTCPATY